MLPADATARDTDYQWDRTKPWQVTDPVGPNMSNEERYTSVQLLRAMSQQPPSRAVPLFRARFGYRTAALGLGDVLNVDAIYKQPRNDFSGGPAGYTGSSVNTLGNL